VDEVERHEPDQLPDSTRSAPIVVATRGSHARWRVGV
jgi:hypothetical protein